jgi:hypothetical protein
VCIIYEMTLIINYVSKEHSASIFSVEELHKFCL